MDWKRLLAYITGTVDQELLLRNEYLVTENRILRNQIAGRVRLTDGERKTLAEIGQKLGKQALAEVAEFIPIKSWAARGAGAPGNCAGHSRAPSRDRGRPPSTGGSGLSQCDTA
jgi:putative transposase